MSVSNAAVLAGGKSTRLGQDKAGVSFNGQQLLVRTIRLAAACCGRVMVVGRDPRPHGIDVPWMLDEQPGLGPIGGIITVIRALKAPCLVLTCDLPFLERPVLDALVQGRAQRSEDAVMTTFEHVQTGYIEPLVAVYEPECLDLLESAVSQGVFKLSRAVPAHRRNHIPCAGGMARSFFNLNYPAELLLLRELERMQGAGGPSETHVEK